VIASVKVVVDVFQLDIVRLMPPTSGSVSLVLQGRQAVAQVLQGPGVVSAIIVLLIPSAWPRPVPPVDGPLVLLRQKIVILVLIAVIVALSASLLLLRSPLGLGQLGREGIVLVHE